MDEEKELKDQRVVTMMTPSELEAIDDWSFKNRIRSRGEAIRRLCQIGVAADENFYAMVDSYIAASQAATGLAGKSGDQASAMEILELMHDFGLAFGKMRSAILSMRQNERIEQSLGELEEIRQAYARHDRTKALELSKAFLEIARTERPPK